MITPQTPQNTDHCIKQPNTGMHGTPLPTNLTHWKAQGALSTNLIKAIMHLRHKEAQDAQQNAHLVSVRH